MSGSLKPFDCPACRSTFTVSSRCHAVSRFPRILSCNHSICEGCLRNAAKYRKELKCAVCETSVDLSEGDILVSTFQPDIYALGILNVNIKNSFLGNLKNKFHSNINWRKSEDSSEVSNTVSCGHCKLNQALWQCDACELNFCGACFNDVHDKIKSKKKHEGKRIFAERYNSVVLEGCSEHENKTVEFYCEVDNQLTCSYCMLVGNHVGHQVKTLMDKNKSCAEDLKTVLEEISVMQKQLKYTENLISETIPLEKVDASDLIKNVHNHFHKLHSVLQVREHQLISQLEEVSLSNVKQLEKMKLEISNFERDLAAARKDAESVIENPCLAISAPAILEKLEACKTLPCYLVPISDDKNKEKIKINLQLDSELEESISQLGKVEYEVYSKFSLLPKSELPDTYSIPEIPDSVSAIDVEESCSTSTDTFSDDSLSVSSLADSTSIQASLKCKDFTKMQPETVVVSHIKSPSSFWVQKCSDLKKLKTLSVAVDKFCRFAEPKKHKPLAVEKGDVYLVQFSQDKKWYRGRVTGILEPKETQNTTEGVVSSDAKKLKKKETLIEVLYIDYGNSETVPLSNFRNIQTRFLNLPGMAKECSLVDIKPANDAAWTIEAITTFTKFVATRPVTMQVYEERNNVYYVDLSQTAESEVSNDVPVSVRDALVFLELAVFPSGKISPRKQRVEPQYMPPEPLRPNVNISAIISHVESPSHFYVQQMSTTSYLSSLIFEMNEVYNNQLNPILFGIFAPRIGMICAAQFSLDDQWYRAQVIGLPGGAKVKVRYVDFGNTEVIHHKFLRKLLNKFSKLNIQAIPCKLADVTYNQEKGWSQQAREWLTNQGSRKQLTLKSLGMIPGENKAEVVLYYSDEDFEICINSLIVEEGLATSCGPHSKEEKKSKPSSSKKQISPKKEITPILEEPACDNFLMNESVAEEKKPQPTFVKPPPDTENKHMEVHVSWIESPDLFYIRIAGENEKKLMMLMDDMQKTYENMEGDLIDCTIGSAYAVMSTSQKKWFRGTVVSKPSDDRIQVHYLDFGMTEEVPKKDVRKLLEKFTLDEAFAVSCHLVGIIPPGGSSKWPNVTIEQFRLLAASHEILLLTSKGEIDERKSLPSDLLIEEIVRGGALEPTRVVYKSITTELLNSGLALPVRKNNKESKPNSVKETVPGNESLASLNGVLETTAVNEPSALIPSPKETSKKENVVLDLKPKFVWKRAVPPSETKFKAFITNIGDDGCIHLYSLCEDPVTVDVIKKALQLRYGKEKPKCLEQVPPVGEACIARFSVDNLWYRAEVISASTSSSKIKVNFVDYGNNELVSLSDISTDIVMQTFPRQCLECVLYGIKPVDSASWDQEILNFLHNQFVEKEVTVEVKAPADKNRRLQCEIVTLSGLSLADLLISMGSAVPISESSSSSCSRITTPDLTTDNTHVHAAFLRATDLIEGHIFPVCITQVNTPNIVYLQRLKIEDPQLDNDKESNNEHDAFLQLIKDLQEKADGFPKLTSPVPGMPCCAKYSYDNAWYRCEVTGLTPDGAVVLYVDYGNSEIVPVENLRVLEDHFINFPVQVHFCELYGVKPVGDDWDPSVKEFLISKLISNQEIFARVVVPGKISKIDLCTKNEDGEFKLVYEELIENKFIILDKTEQ